MAKPDLSGAFGLGFQEQIAFFRGKINMPTSAWDDLWQEEHDTAFAVAGAMKADLLNDLRRAVDQSISQGTGLKEFREEFRDIVQRRGWHGWTGEGTKKGEAWRTRVILETNMRTSYAAGRYAQLTDPELLARCPYWQYVHSDNAMHPRPQHKAWGDAKLTLPHDHPFWQTGYPPNGWGCGCTVRAVRAPDADATTDLPEGWDAINPRTGEPEGIDSGWGYAPGASRAEEVRELAKTKAADLPQPLQDDLLKAITPPPAIPPVIPPVAGLVTVDDFIAAGRKITEHIDETAAHASFMQLYQQHVKTGLSCKTVSTGQGAQHVREASALFPVEWVQAADSTGPLYVKESMGRCWHITILKSGMYRLDNFGVVFADIGNGYMTVRDLENSVHEFAHRIQASLPALDDLFQAFHTRRTSGDPLKSLKKLTGDNYRTDELSREDHYIHAYFGKDYDGKALEVLTMSMETVIAGGKEFNQLYIDDREMLDFIAGVLFYWRP